MINSFEDAARELNKVTPGSPAWGLQWNMLGIVLFQIWNQQNQRRMQDKADPKKELLKRSIDDGNRIRAGKIQAEKQER